MICKDERVLCNNYLKSISLFGSLFLTSLQYFDHDFFIYLFYKAIYFQLAYYIDRQDNSKVYSTGQSVKKETSTYFFKKNNTVTENFHIFDTDMKCAEFF